MPLPDHQLRECLAATGAFLSKRRPGPELRDQIDYRADIDGQTLTLLCVRPKFDDDTQKVAHPFARMRWVGAQKVWKLYWMMSDLKWHSYPWLPKSPSIAALMAEVDRDPHCAFFG